MKSAITLCLVDEAQSGPFVLRGDLTEAFGTAKRLGFDGVEVFAPGPSDPRWSEIGELLLEFDLRLAAVGTGAGFLRHQWTLTATDGEIRHRATHFIRQMIDVAGAMGAPVIIGSMQGRVLQESDRPRLLDEFAKTMRDLSQYAMDQYGQPILLEPLNRYESNLWNRLEETMQWLDQNQCPYVQLLGDLFHMNIEEESMERAIVAVGERLGHLHFADSNRRAVGMGHTDMTAIMAALRSVSYTGYLSAEIFPWPTAVDAAQQSITSFRCWTEKLPA